MSKDHWTRCTQEVTGDQQGHFDVVGLKPDSLVLEHTGSGVGSSEWGREARWEAGNGTEGSRDRVLRDAIFPVVKTGLWGTSNSRGCGSDPLSDK